MENPESRPPDFPRSHDFAPGHQPHSFQSNPDPVQPVKRGDIATYRRLLGYLKGSGHLITFAFVCMFLEAFFTVSSIAMLKPVLDLLEKKPLTSMLGKGTGELEVSSLQMDNRGTAALAVRGYWEPDGLQRILERRADLLTSAAVTQLVTLDLAEVQRLDDASAQSLEQVIQFAEKANLPIVLVMPPGHKSPPRPFGQFDMKSRPTVLVLDSAAPLSDQFRRAHSRHVVFDEGSRSEGPFSGAKRWVGSKLRPLFQDLQSHADSSARNRFQVMAVFVGAMIFLAACGVLAKMTNGYLSNMLAARAVQRLRDDLFRHMLGLDLSYFHNHSAGTLMSTVIQDAQAVDAALEIMFSSVVKTPITVGSLILAMFIVSPQLTLATLGAAPIIGLIIYLLGRRVRKVSGRIQLVKSTLSGILEESFNGMRIVKGYCTEEREANRFSEANNRIFRLGLKTIAAEEIGGGLSHLVGMATIGLMVLGGGWFVVVNGGLSAGDFALFVGFLSQVFRPMRDVSKVNAKLQRGLAGCDRVFGTLDTPALIVSPSQDQAQEARPPIREIRFEGIGFTYGGDRPPALSDIQLVLEAGKSLAVVGETGSGKSTLANLLPRFMDPTQGSILWDGTDIRQFDLPSLRRQIALITQDVVLFDDTVAGNIAYGCVPAPSEDQIIAAAKAARAHQFIEGRMPEGYKTRVGARGVRLSGGERQRLAIARAILRNAPVLILDEATSALDSETEALVQQALQELFPGRTVLVIAHRLATVQACDAIIVMSHGRIVERGTHSSLLQSDGHYARYYRLQSGGAEPPAISLEMTKGGPPNALHT